jgi:NADH dehydrogenase
MGAGERPRVVIVGAGFGGLTCARRLDGAPVDVLLIDRHNYHLFTPLLYQVATALLNPSDVAYPLRTVFRRSRNVRFRQAEVVGVDRDRCRVRTATGEEIPYDRLVLATGSTDNYFGNEEVARAAIGLKTLEQALRLRNHVLACLEQATVEVDREERRSLLTFVVVGGGPTGVEYAGALMELLQLVSGRDYPDLARGEARVLLVEGRARLLPGFAPRLGRYAERALSRRGVEVRTGVEVASADSGSVRLADGSLVGCRTIVWSAGVRPDDPLGQDAPRRRSHRLEVDQDLRLAGAPAIFAIGDAAAAAPSGSELPMLSPPAMQAARHVARTIREELSGRSHQRSFRYVDKGTMATIGRGAAVGELWGLHITGFPAWLAWIFVHVYYLVGFRNRVLALGSWALNYLRFDRPIRIVLQAQPDPLAERVTGGRR